MVLIEDAEAAETGDVHSMELAAAGAGALGRAHDAVEATEAGASPLPLEADNSADVAFDEPESGLEDKRLRGEKKAMGGEEKEAGGTANAEGVVDARALIEALKRARVAMTAALWLLADARAVEADDFAGDPVV